MKKIDPNDKETTMIGNHQSGYKVTNPKPKDWANVKRSEGRSGKSTRSRKIKLREEAWSLQQLQGHLADIKAGLPECNWTLTCASPARILTPSDYLHVMYAEADIITTYIEVHSNMKHRVLHIEELDFLPKGK